MGSFGGAESVQESVESRLAPLAAAQHGVFTRAHATVARATKRMIQRRVTVGRWEELFPGVFRIAGTPPSWRQSLIAACFAWGDGATSSHRAAAALWKLSGLDPGLPEVTVPRGRARRHAAGIIVHRSPPLPPGDVTRVGAIPVTTVARTLIDLASVVPREVLEEALDDALRRRLVSLARLHWRLSELSRCGRPGIVVIRSLIAARDPASAVPESVFETRLLRVMKEARLPRPTLQHRVRHDGRVVAVVDFAFPAARLAVEADGYRWHSGRVRWEHDLARRNALTSAGWRIIHVTWTDLATNPAALLQRIERVLRSNESRPTQ